MFNDFITSTKRTAAFFLVLIFISGFLCVISSDNASAQIQPNKYSMYLEYKQAGESVIKYITLDDTNITIEADEGTIVNFYLSGDDKVKFYYNEGAFTEIRPRDNTIVQSRGFAFTYSMIQHFSAGHDAVFCTNYGSKDEPKWFNLTIRSTIYSGT